MITNKYVGPSSVSQHTPFRSVTRQKNWKWKAAKRISSAGCFSIQSTPG